MTSWNHRAAHYERDYKGAPIRTRIAGEIVREVLHDRPMVILDAGAGQGHLALELKIARPEARLILVDNSQNMLAVAHQRMVGQSRVEFLQTTFDDLRYVETASVDFFTSTFALHHVDNKRKLLALREARRVLKPSGHLMIADEILCDPALLGNPEQTLLAMGEVFYPELDIDELHQKFDGFVEYPTDLTTMASIALEAGLEPTFRAVNKVVAILEAVTFL